MTDTLIYSPFKGITPAPAHAADVIAPPYDVLSSAEAKQKAAGKPYSFLHISKAEIDFADEISPYDDRVYAKAAANFAALLKQHILVQDAKPCYYVYQMTMGDHTQTGLAVAASVQAYDQGRIKRHELTRVAKENDRVKQIRAVGAQTGPALLINKEIPAVKSLLRQITATRPPLFSVIGDNDVRHTLWRVDDSSEVTLITTSFAAQNEAYIADGHHRSAAASRLAAEDGLTESGRFLAVAFFEEEMRIWDYNRVVFDLNGKSETDFLNEVAAAGFAIAPSPQHKPTRKGQFMLYLNHTWYEMNDTGAPLGTDPVSALDVSLLSAKVLDNILDIKDLRHSERIDFIGGIRGAREIERLVDQAPNRAGFMLFPTAVEELLAVADNKMLMPPKSTWFEPKLADGVVSLQPEK